jgi:hypothetical protein
VYGSRKKLRLLGLTAAKAVQEATMKVIKPSGNHWCMVQERNKAVRPYHCESGSRNK